MRCRRIILTIFVYCLCTIKAEESAVDVLTDIYKTCVSNFAIDCAKPKAMQWLSDSATKDTIKLTENLSIIRISKDKNSEQRGAVNFFEKVDDFLADHALRIAPTKVLQDETIRSFIPKSLLRGGLANGLIVPLSEGKSIEGRGFVKKVMIPFLLGLKFKSTVLVPLSLALIALKSWKAMTLGLLSLVLAGAMVIFKFAKPKIVNYEIVHFPHHPHVPHVDHHPIIHDGPHWARKLESEELAYKGYYN
ncbi:uncharacterized protein LOC134835317 [Culicoides brevitarsis]|uniref:uncharacterized protein LOC134835317 n=1 Tax=Culicoides brevitarsis TaxID=469753 RepID=UPI00307CB6E6